MNQTTEKECPRCGKLYTDYPALSRRDNKTDICSNCGEAEAMLDYHVGKTDGSKLYDSERKMWKKPIKYDEHYLKPELLCDGGDEEDVDLEPRSKSEIVCEICTNHWDFYYNTFEPLEIANSHIARYNSLKYLKECLKQARTGELAYKTTEVDMAERKAMEARYRKAEADKTPLLPDGGEPERATLEELQTFIKDGGRIHATTMVPTITKETLKTALKTGMVDTKDYLIISPARWKGRIDNGYCPYCPRVHRLIKKKKSDGTVFLYCKNHGEI